jgi:hypothetical protein
MKKSLLFLFLMIITLSLQAQKDSTSIAGMLPQQNKYSEAANINISIYPVPVRENSFTIKADRDISIIRVTNIIGQDIYRIQFNNPVQLVKIPLENPKRGMYLVTIIFGDGIRVVKKIMVEESE